jgi:aerobic-type carbon monoxide dehydrogenase small subunit (CoxS/CutS family)
MQLQLNINGIDHQIDCTPSETLLAAVRRLGYYGVKFGDEHGLSGAPVNGWDVWFFKDERGRKIVIDELQ